MAINQKEKQVPNIIDTTTRLHNIMTMVEEMEKEVGYLIDHADTEDFKENPDFDPQQHGGTADFIPVSMNAARRYNAMDAAFTNLHNAVKMLDVAHHHSIKVDKE